MIGTYELSIDFGTTTSYPFLIKTKMYGTGLSNFAPPVFTKLAWKKNLTPTHECASSGLTAQI